MTGRSAIGALAGGLGVACGVVASAAVAAAVLVALGLPDQSRADDAVATPVHVAPPRELVVGLSLGDPVLQAGVVRDGEVVLARGFEVDVARAIARRLRIRHVRFVDVRPSSRLLTARVRPWGIAVASVRPSRAAATAAELSIPYLATDQAIVPRRALAVPRTLADLRHLALCAVRGGEGATVLAGSVRPRATPLLAPSTERLLELVRTGQCDAALVDAVSVGRLLSGRKHLFGPVVAKVEHGEGLVVAVTRHGPVPAASIDRVLRRLRTDGTLHRLAQTWLRVDPARLRSLR